MILVLDWKLCIANETCHTIYYLSMSIAMHTVNIKTYYLLNTIMHTYINILVLILNKYNMYHDEMHICTVASYIHTLQQH